MVIWKPDEETMKKIKEIAIRYAKKRETNMREYTTEYAIKLAREIKKPLYNLIPLGTKVRIPMKGNSRGIGGITVVHSESGNIRILADLNFLRKINAI